MTKQECAVIEAYTGTCMLQGEDRKFFYEYLEHLFGRPVFTHEIPKLADKIKEKSKSDFMCICENAFDVTEPMESLLELLLDEEEDEDEEYEDEDINLAEIFGMMINGIPECERCDNGEYDPVNRPKHYQSKAGIEVIDVIDAFTEDLSGIEAVCTGNILKYVCRWKQKNGLQDLEKAKWYLDKLIKEVSND